MPKSNMLLRVAGSIKQLKQTSTANMLHIGRPTTAIESQSFNYIKALTRPHTNSSRTNQTASCHRATCLPPICHITVPALWELVTAAGSTPTQHVL